MWGILWILLWIGTLLGELLNNCKLSGNFETLGNWILEVLSVLSSLDYGLYSDSMHDNWVWQDLRLALAMAEDVAQPTPVAASVNDIYKRAKAEGLGDQDFSAIIEAYLLDPKGLNHWQKLCATLLVASRGCLHKCTCHGTWTSVLHLIL